MKTYHVYREGRIAVLDTSTGKQSPQFGVEELTTPVTLKDIRQWLTSKQSGQISLSPWQRDAIIAILECSAF